MVCPVRANAPQEAGSLRTYRGRRSVGKIFGYLLAMLMIFSGLALVGYSFLIGDPLASAAIFGKEPPTGGDLSLTVPEMRRVEDVPVITGPASDKSALHDGTLHVNSTGFPWQDGANVYIAGHRMGFPGTRSFLVFYDLDVLENGDEVYLTDADGTRYTYEVFTQFVTDPYDWGPTDPEAGKSILTLQTCTLPDYTQRLIVKAELTKVEPGEEAEQTPEAKTAQEVEPKQSKSEQDEPIPVEPIPVEPIPVEPIPVEPIPVEPIPVEPEAPALVQEVEPAPVEPG